MPHIAETKAPHEILLARKQAIGAYYTPTNVASILANWCIRDASISVLEPCFGGCDFLEAIRERLIELGSINYEKHIFGCDIDQEAIGHLSKRISADTSSGNFLRADFLEVTSQHFGKAGFDAVVGNPPYIKNSRLTDSQKRSVRQLPDHIHEVLSGRSNLWAYFILHSMTFLKAGSRMAWVLPGTFLTSQYAEKLRNYLCDHFSSVRAISVAERLFVKQGTEERTAILTCEGYLVGTKANIEIEYCQTIDELVRLLELSQSTAPSPEKTSFSRFLPEQLEIIERSGAVSNAVPISEYGKVYIGIVLGDKGFFVKRKSDWLKQGIDCPTIEPLVTKFGQLRGISLENEDIENWESEDSSVFFLNTTRNHSTQVVAGYLSSRESSDLGRNSTFARRKIWHHADDGRLGDAFIASLHQWGPRIVLNTSKLQATNSVYRFNFYDDVLLATRQKLCLAVLTTYSQLTAELAGRQLGSGGLKLEPSELKRVMIPSCNSRSDAETEQAFQYVDYLLRSKMLNEARHFADNFFFADILDEKEILILQNALQRIRSHRLRR